MREKKHALFVGPKWFNCDPANILSQSEVLLWGSFIASGAGTAEVFYVDEEYGRWGEQMGVSLLKRCKQSAPDVLIIDWLMGPQLRKFNIGLETLYIIRSKFNIPVASIWYDTWTPELLAETEKVLPFVDVAVITDSLSHFQDSVHLEKCISLNPPPDTRWFYDPGKQRDIHVSFNGAIVPYPDRISGIAALKRAGIPIAKCGGQAEQRLSLSQYADVFMRSKITINFCMSGERKTLKGRVMEATLCGAMLLEKENDETARWFTPGEHYVPFTDEDDLIAKTKYYINHPKERQRIAEQGKSRAQELCQPEYFWGKIVEEAQRRRQTASEVSLLEALRHLARI